MLCTFNRIIYEKEETGYMISSFFTEDPSVPQEARSKYGNSITAVGYNLPKTNAVNFEITGTWQPSKYGLQLAVETCSEIIPKTEDGIYAYLTSGLVKGIGEKTAKAIVKTFGANTIDIMEKEPDRLLEVKGVSAKKLTRITKTFQESRTIRDIVAFLAPYGVTPRKCSEIQKEFGANTLQVLHQTPYELTRISGFGFKTVDAIARKTHASMSDPMRIQGALRYVLEQSMTQGHLYLEKEDGSAELTKDDIRMQAQELLNDSIEGEPISLKQIHRQLCAMVKSEEFVYEPITKDNGVVYLPFNYKHETTAARIISDRLCACKSEEAEVDSLISEAENEIGIMLAKEQRDAVKMALGSDISIITGGPGTGKSTTLRLLLHCYHRLNESAKIALAAPTGKAARRMAECTGLPASTLHSMLGLQCDPTNDHGFSGEPDMVNADFIVVDESSMIDMALFSRFMESVRTKTKLLFVGDADQLPSVGAGNVFRELIECGRIPVTRLKLVFRQSGVSRIAQNASLMQEGSTNFFWGEDFKLIETKKETEDEDLQAKAADIVCKQYLDAVKELGVENVQILSPFKARGEASVKALNDRLHDLVNPPDPGKNELKAGSRYFREGDRVIQVKNTEDASNGDVGIIRSICKTDDDEYMVIDFGDGRDAEYSAEDLSILELAYAITVHKSQGAEYKTVIMPMLSAFWIMLRRNLIYTGITRAKQKVILVGEKKAIFTAVHKNDIDKRNTRLASRINELYLKHKKY